MSGARSSARLPRGFTIVELLVVIVVAAIVISLAAPSLRNMIQMQRLRGTSAQFVTDVQYLRSEAVSRQEVMGMRLAINGQMSCYILYACGTTAASACTCDCTQPEGSRCTAPITEVRTVQLPRSESIRVITQIPSSSSSSVAPFKFAIEPATGSMLSYFPIVLAGPAPTPATEFWADVQSAWSSGAPTLRTKISAQGRPSVCSPSGAVSGVPSC